MVTKGGMVMVTRLAGYKEGDDDGNSNYVGNGDGNNGGMHAKATKVMATAMAMTWTMAMATRVVGNEEGYGN
jgi:hypothetical protein